MAAYIVQKSLREQLNFLLVTSLYCSQRNKNVEYFEAFFNHNADLYA